METLKNVWAAILAFSAGHKGTVAGFVAGVLVGLLVDGLL